MEGGFVRRANLDRSMKLQVLLLFFFTAPSLPAQDGKTAVQVSDTDRLPEAEFVGSTSFRWVEYVQPLRKGLRLEVDYFAGDEKDVGYKAPSWELRWRGLRLGPRFGVAFSGTAFRQCQRALTEMDIRKELVHY